MKKSNGFTLIEVLVYLALFSIVFFGLFSSAFAVMGNIGRNEAQIALLEEGGFLLAKIEREPDFSVFSAEGGVLKLSGAPISNSQMAVDGLVFENPGGGRLVSVRFNLATKTGAGQECRQDFGSTYLLRQ